MAAGPAAMPRGVKSLPPWGTAAGEHFWRQSRAARRQDPAAQRHDGSPLPPCHVAVGPFLFFEKNHFKNTFSLFKNNKLISVSIITREYHNQRVDANSLYKIMVKVVLHLNASVPLRPNSSSASPGVVPIVRSRSGALTTRGPSWSGNSVAMAACDEPAAFGVPPPAGVAPPTVALPTGVAPPAAGVAPPCGCVG
jgi:hypothetical protein